MKLGQLRKTNFFTVEPANISTIHVCISMKSFPAHVLAQVFLTQFMGHIIIDYLPRFSTLQTDTDCKFRAIYMYMYMYINMPSAT